MYPSVLKAVLACLAWAISASLLLSATRPPPAEKYLVPIELTEPSSSMRLVDCIYVINLDARAERWEWMKSQCAAHRIAPNRVSAVNGLALPLRVRRELTSPYPLRLRGGQLGCLLSHLSVLKDAQQRGFDVIWVMEDDVEFLEDPHQLPALLVQLTAWDPDWDVFFTDIDFRHAEGGYYRSTGSDFRPGKGDRPTVDLTERIGINDSIMQIRSRFGTHSMLISKKGIKKIYDFFVARPFWTAIDIEMHYIPSIREYSSRRDIVSNLRGSPSDTAGEDLPLD